MFEVYDSLGFYVFFILLGILAIFFGVKILLSNSIKFQQRFCKHLLIPKDYEDGTTHTICMFCKKDFI